MSDLGKKVGYLKGLMEGMDFSGDPSKEKLLGAMADLMSELADRVEAMEELLDDLNDYVESIDDDLAMLEGSQGENPHFMDDDEHDDYLDDLTEGEDQLHLLRPAQDGDDSGEEALAGNLCPKCSRMFFTALDNGEDAEYLCPHCGERVKPLPLTPDNAPIAKPVED
jgi:DNA-directed RNA polymerase subunit RPC12/RpoP